VVLDDRRNGGGSGDASGNGGGRLDKDEQPRPSGRVGALGEEDDRTVATAVSEAIDIVMPESCAALGWKGIRLWRELNVRLVDSYREECVRQGNRHVAIYFYQQPSAEPLI